MNFPFHESMLSRDRDVRAHQAQHPAVGRAGEAGEALTFSFCNLAFASVCVEAGWTLTF